MDINNLQLAAKAYESASISSTSKTTAKDKTISATDSKQSTTTVTDDTAVIYEKSSVAEQMKYDTQIRTTQLLNYVKETLFTQAGFSSEDVDAQWKFLADGNFTVSKEVSDDAKEAISEDGYWGVEQTSDRILNFAKAISGNNSEMADKLLKAFQDGFEAATSSWGKELPEISQQTFNAVQDKFQAWKDGKEEIDQNPDQLGN